MWESVTSFLVSLETRDPASPTQVLVIHSDTGCPGSGLRFPLHISQVK